MKLQALCLFPVCLAMAAVSHAATTYQETFPDATAGNISHASLGWAALYGSTALDSSSNTTNNANGGFVVSNLGGGYGAKTTFASSYGVAYTTEVAANNITTADITSISFLAKSAASTDRYRVVIAIDVSGLTQWYASDTFFTTAAGTWADGAESKSLAFTTAASSWRLLTLTASELSLSDSTLGAGLPNGNLVAAGLFLSGNNTAAGTSGGAHANTMRYDNFTVTVPEPSAVLFGITGLGFCLRMRKRRS